MRPPNHYEETVAVNSSPSDLFNFLDNHNNLSSHMNKPSLMMGGGKMETILDESKGQKAGSHVILKGKAFGLDIYLDEVVTEHNYPYSKKWETVGEPKLIIIGNYQMGFAIAEQGKHSELTVFINYDLPTGKTRFLGKLFGRMYSIWCVRQIIGTAQKHS